jgi:hypothetical protein
MPMTDALSSDWVEALSCAMAIVPTAYSRNKMFAFYKQPEVRRAKARARAMRSLGREIAGRLGRATDIELTQTDTGWVLRFRIPSVGMGRTADLSQAELACVVHLVGAFGGEAKWAPPHREILEGTLARLPIDLRPSTTALT